MKETSIGSKKLLFVQGDITHERTDAIVNAANSSLMGGGGVDGAIHHAGGPAILKECKSIVLELGRLPSGHAVITTGGNLPARHVIHTVGPVWHGGSSGEPATLKQCYISSLKLADDSGLHSIAFPSISTGAYGYPTEDAAHIAVSAVKEVLASTKNIEEVHFVLFDKQTYEAYASQS